jgi:N-methylhydantoinase B
VDLIQLELMWSNLRSVVTEQARAMQRTAFSPVVREAGDLAYALFDARGRMVAQADTGTPGHINCLAFTAKYLADRYAGQLEPGDVLITNDPWLGAGHFNDIAVVAPIFWGDKLIGYVGSTNHHSDIGGLGVGVAAHDVHEEGLWIPPTKLYERGRPNQTLFDLIGRNVRTPDYVAGDIAAQVSSARAGGEEVIELCQRYEMPDIEGLADEIIALSESAMRNSIRACRGGTWTGETRFDLAGGLIITLKAAVTIDNVRGDVLIDFAGSTPQVDKGINVVLNYTHAYSTFTVRSCLTPDLPNNAGSLAPIKVSAPPGSILNCEYPAPVAARHVVGMYVPMPVLRALYNVMPDRVLAEGPGAVWSAQILGRDHSGKQFTSSQFSFSGGMGARAHKPGPSATCYPTGIGATPIEVLEMETPVVFHRRELRPGSGGDGRSRGGDGQIVEFGVRTGLPWTLNAAPTGTMIGAAGLAGGEPGATGRFVVNGADWHARGKTTMNPDDVVHMETPGAGGFGPRQRNATQSESAETEVEFEREESQ